MPKEFSIFSCVSILMFGVVARATLRMMRQSPVVTRSTIEDEPDNFLKRCRLGIVTIRLFAPPAPAPCFRREIGVAGGRMKRAIATIFPDHCNKPFLSGLKNGTCVIHETR